MLIHLPFEHSSAGLNITISTFKSFPKATVFTQTLLITYKEIDAERKMYFRDHRATLKVGGGGVCVRAD